MMLVSWGNLASMVARADTYGPLMASMLGLTLDARPAEQSEAVQGCG
jgi:hypothetical protein